MKRLTVVMLLISATIFGQEKQANVFTPDKGDWLNDNNWSLGRVPESNDIIIIKSKCLIIINKSISLGNVDITTNGQIILSGAGLQLDESSRLIVAEAGSIVAENRSEEESIILGKILKFSGSKDEGIKGFSVAFIRSGESPEGFSFESYRSPDQFYDKSNSWANSDSWSLGRIPQEGDSIIILQNSEVLLQEGQQLEDVSIRISGQLTLDKASIDLGSPSSVTIEKTGMLQSSNGVEEESLYIGKQLKFDGSGDKSITGFGVANSKTGISPNGFSSDATLPVTLTDFQAKVSNRVLLVQWTTQNEVNNLEFDIQQSNDGVLWQDIGTVYPAHTGVLAGNYSFAKKISTVGLMYVRLKQVDVDLKFTYSKTIVLNVPVPEFHVSMAVHSGNVITLNVDEKDANDFILRILDMQGNILYRRSMHSGISTINAPAITHSQRKLHVLQLVNNQGFKYSRSFYTH
jgi:hypothetical protein